MIEPTPLGGPELVLRLDVRREPVAGVLSTRGGLERTFHGWLELLALLEEVRDEIGADPAEDRERA